MKKILLSIAILGFCLNSMADTSTNSGLKMDAELGTTSTTTNSTSSASASTNSNQQSITFTTPADTTSSTNVTSTSRQDINYSGTQTIKNVPSVNGPSLTTSNDTCMGSTSGSVNIAGLGVGGGSSWVDSNCKMLKNSRELWNMGMKAAALALICTDSANREALELTGFECPQTTKANKDAASRASADTAYSGTDTFVRARLGLPPSDSK